MLILKTILKLLGLGRDQDLFKEPSDPALSDRTLNREAQDTPRHYDSSCVLCSRPLSQCTCRPCRSNMAVWTWREVSQTWEFVSGPRSSPPPYRGAFAGHTVGVDPDDDGYYYNSSVRETASMETGQALQGVVRRTTGGTGATLEPGEGLAFESSDNLDHIVRNQEGPLDGREPAEPKSFREELAEVIEWDQRPRDSAYPEAKRRRNLVRD